LLQSQNAACGRKRLSSLEPGLEGLLKISLE